MLRAMIRVQMQSSGPSSKPIRIAAMLNFKNGAYKIVLALTIIQRPSRVVHRATHRGVKGIGVACVPELPYSLAPWY